VYPAIVVVLVTLQKEASEMYDLTGPPLATIIAEETVKTRPDPSIPTPGGVHTDRDTSLQF
jgi:hypothetical protein